MQEKVWYKEKPDDIYNSLDTKEDGLTFKQANERLLKYGKNELPKKKPDSFFKIFLKQLLDPIEILLIVAMLFSFIINELVSLM